MFPILVNDPLFLPGDINKLVSVRIQFRWMNANVYIWKVIKIRNKMHKVVTYSGWLFKAFISYRQHWPIIAEGCYN